MLTVATVKAIRPKAEKFDFMDPDNPGFGVRVMPSGAKTFMFRYKIGGRCGRVRRMMLGSADVVSLKDARAAYAEARRQLVLGTDPLDARVEAAFQAEQDITFAVLAGRYISEYASRKRTGAEDERILRHDALPKWGKRKAREITKRDVVALLDRIVARGAATQANRSFACIRKVFNWAVAKDLVPASPCAGVAMPSKNNAKDRVLSDEEIRQFWTLKLPYRVQMALRLQLVLGQRIGEIVGMRWSEVDVPNQLWVLPAERAKNGIVHTIPLPDVAVGIIRDMHLLRVDTHQDQVFPAARGKAPHLRVDSIGTVLARAIRAAGMDRFTSHDLRRTAATRISGAGTSREVLRQILNHKDNSVTGRYDRHRFDKEKREALEAWERTLLGIVCGQQQSNVVSLQRLKAGA